MPYTVSSNASGCSGFAVVKEGTNEPIPGGCHNTKADAIAHMVAVQSAYEHGEGRALIIGVEEEEGLTGRQNTLYSAYEAVVEQFGMFDQGIGADGAHYVEASPFAAQGMICANCAFYEGGQRCEIVEGQINPNAICKLWIISESLLSEEPEEEPSEYSTREQPRDKLGQFASTEGSGANEATNPKQMPASTEKVSAETVKLKIDPTQVPYSDGTGTQKEWDVLDKSGNHVGSIRKVRERESSYDSGGARYVTNWYSQARLKVQDPKISFDRKRSLEGSKRTNSKEYALQDLIKSHNAIIDINANAGRSYSIDEQRAEVSLVPPTFMRVSAKRGLALHEEGYSGDGLKPATVADARKMANGEALSADKWRRIGPWIARHIVDLDAVQGDEITAGLVAMLLWGGGSSKSSARRTQDYAERLVARLDEERSLMELDTEYATGSEETDDAE